MSGDQTVTIVDYNGVSLDFPLADVIEALGFSAAGRCDCSLDDPYHRWNCSLTPIWSQTMRDLDTNPWTVMKPEWGSWQDHCGRGPCCLGEGHTGRCRL